MAHSRLIWIILFLTKQVCLVRCGSPYNTAVENGSIAHLTCSWRYALSTQWSEYSTNPEQKTQLSFDSTIVAGLPQSKKDRYSIIGDFSAKEYDLLMFPVLPQDAGEYECQIFDGDSSSFAFYHAQLIVIKADLSCNLTLYISDADPAVVHGSTLVAGEKADVTCSIGYAGNWAPDIICLSSQFEQISVTNASNEDSSLTWKEAVITTRFESNGGVSETIVTCGIAFDDHEFPEDYATTAGVVHYDKTMPEYQSTWTSKKIYIQYNPRDLSIEPELERYEVGMNVTCSSNANPEATYEWYRVDDNTLLASGSMFTVPEEFEDDDVLVKCVARNIIRGIIHVSTVQVEITAYTDGSIDWWIYLLIALIILIVIIMVLIIICCKTKNRNKVSSSSEKTTHISTRQIIHNKYSNKTTKKHTNNNTSDGPPLFNLVKDTGGVFYIDDYSDVEKAKKELHEDQYGSGLLETPPPNYDDVIAVQSTTKQGQFHSSSHV